MFQFLHGRLIPAFLVLLSALAVSFGLGCGDDPSSDAWRADVLSDVDDRTARVDTADGDVSVMCDPDPLLAMTYDETPDAGPLRNKAEAYDSWHERWHQPNYGSTVNTVFTDANRTAVRTYDDTWDSCLWTGTYLASQALRYHVTGDPRAKANAIRSARTLDRHLHVTGRPGFIARYVGPLSDPVYGDIAGGCATHEDWHCLDEGEFAGDFWFGDTSHDSYSGWFFGMSLAYDLIDDEPTREMIRADVAEVVDRLMADDWWIIDVDGIRTNPGPRSYGAMRMSWALIAWQVTGEQRFLDDVLSQGAPENRLIVRAAATTWPIRYIQHFAFNYTHQNFFNLLRVSRPFCDLHEFLRVTFRQQVHRHVHLQHNAFYTLIHMSQGIKNPWGSSWNAQEEQMIGDLTDFRDAPNFRYRIAPPPPAETDPVSVWLRDLQQRYPWLIELFQWEVKVQALDAYPVPLQCSWDFLWQGNMWNMNPCGSNDPTYVNAGVDYLVAYWMASAYGYLAKDQ